LRAAKIGTQTIDFLNVTTASPGKTPAKLYFRFSKEFKATLPNLPLGYYYTMYNSRRTFIQKIGLGGMGMFGVPGMLAAEELYDDNKEDKKGLTVLFQGDSITDGNRGRNNDWNHVMGHGYAFLIASRLWYQYTSKNLMFYNRGNSGDRVKDLELRWQADTINLRPDIISILVGINDVLGTIYNHNPEPIATFEATFKKLLDKTKAALPHTKIILCEPFILPVGMVTEKKLQFDAEIAKRQAVTKKLAGEYHATFVELQKPFNDACKRAPANYWIWDGIHPMPAGHELIARQWIKKAKQLMPFIKDPTT
jgi:lysophospholipase L1-like esterase